MTATEQNTKPGAIITGRVESLSLDGRGVLHVGPRRVLVEGAWPGDQVEALVYRRRRGNGEARTTAVLCPGHPRREPACTHTGECGGCKWQQWSVDQQREMKRLLLEHALAEAGVQRLEVLPTGEAGPEFGYRNKMEFSFGTDRDSGRVTLGLHRAGRFDWTFDLERCWLPGPRATDVVVWVREWANRYGLAAYRQRTHEGLLRHLVVRESAATGQIMVVLVAAHDQIDGLDELAEGLPSAVPQVTSTQLGVNARLGDTAIAETTHLLAGERTITERIGHLTVELSWRSFLQTNSVGAAVLYDLVADAAGLTGVERVLDLYCGIGLIGLWLAPAAREVVGLESVSDAVADARRLAERVGARHVRIAEGEAEALLPQWQANGDDFDVVVTDPPRAGMHPKALAALLSMAPPRIVYVSCSPRALASDMEKLVHAGYTPAAIQPVDMFPQTAHVECVVRLDRRSVSA